ncbi:MAG: crossover junction endodeoxyribonuclease RuvC [Patescibacteria group bacterium]
MIFLGIDPGTTKIGYGIVEYQNNAFSCLAYGIIGKPGTDRQDSFLDTATRIRELITQFRPVAAGIERLFFEKNQKTAMAVSEMRGVILATLAQCGIPVHELTPLEVKKSISGYGRAEKRQVQLMVQRILGYAEPIRPDDAADALAIAISCASAPR